MKILVITDLYPIQENEKNTPRTIYDFIQGWKTMGHKVKVIKPNFVLNSFLRKKPFYKSDIYGEVENLNYWLPFLGNIKHRIKTSLDADVVVAHMPSGLIFANKLGLNIPLIAGVHVSDIEVLTNPIYSIYFKTELLKAYKNASRIACRSEILKQKFVKLLPEYEHKTFIAYSGIDENMISKRNWRNSDKIRVITCANLIKRKNIDKVITACENIENIKLTIIGDGIKLNNLRKISSKPEFLGHLSHNKVLEEMRKADIFILPSQNETFGMVYLEAMASGCITIGLKGDGIDGIIKDSFNGYLCNLDSISDVLNDIVHSNNQNQILENSYNTILNYTKQKACQNYIDSIFS